MNIVVSNNLTLVQNTTPEERAWLRDYLIWSKAGRGARPQSLFKDDSFPAGLSTTVAKAGRQEGFKVTAQDSRIRPTTIPRPVPESWLRDYQHEAVSKCLSPLPLPGRGIIKAPTGSGKSRCAASISWSLPLNWLILVDTKDLMRQMSQGYGDLTGEACGRIGDGIWEPKRVTVSTIQTLLDRFRSQAVKDLLAQTQGVIIDEVHTSAAAGFRKVILASSAYYRFGFSATPTGREDKADILHIGAVGPIIYSITSQELHQAGITAQAEIIFESYTPEGDDYWAEVKSLIAQERTEDAYRIAYRIGVVESEARNRKVLELITKAPKPALLFIKSIDHGNTLKRMLSQSGISVDYVHGQNVSSDRKAAIRRLERGDIDVLICSKIFNKGIDIPSARGLVNASGGASDIDTIQKLGRGTRMSEGKDRVVYYDLYDSPPFLESHSKKRMKAYESEGYKVIRK